MLAITLRATTDCANPTNGQRAQFTKVKSNVHSTSDMCATHVHVESGQCGHKVRQCGTVSGFWRALDNT